MALINRVTRLFKADFHAVLDQIEEPEQILKQAIRDMEDELQEAERRISACARESELLAKRQVEVERSIEETNDQLDLCFESGKDQLARGLVRKKLEGQRFLRQLNDRLDANAEFLAEQRRNVEENRSTLDGLKQKAEVFARRSPSGAADFDMDEASWLGRGLTVSEDEVEIALLRELAERQPS